MGTQQRFLRLVALQTRAEPLTEGSLEPVHGGFGERAAVVANRDLPSGASEEPHLLDGAVAFAPVVPGVEHRTGARRGEPVSLMALGGRVTHAPVVSPVPDGDSAWSGRCDVPHGAEHLTVVLLAGGDNTRDERAK